MSAFLFVYLYPTEIVTRWSNNQQCLKTEGVSIISNKICLVFCDFQNITYFPSTLVYRTNIYRFLYISFKQVQLVAPKTWSVGTSMMLK